MRDFDDILNQWVAMKDNGQADKAEKKKCEHLLAFLRDLNRCRDLDRGAPLERNHLEC
jgi:hypothetical protein